MNRLRIIGDVHGQIDEAMPGLETTYLEILEGADHSVQLGDMGNAESYEKLRQLVDPGLHRFFGGNHEAYPLLPEHQLGDFGDFSLGGVSFFFVRGALSSDKETLLETGARDGTILWHEEEELNPTDMNEAAASYERSRPLIVLSHDAPSRIARMAYLQRQALPGSQSEWNPSRTTVFLESLLSIHRPGLWVFGHHHHDWSHYENGTLFRCVGELSWIDINNDAEIVGRSLPRL